ncbi:MAG: DUF4440 domain-containing protein [Gemmatimonadetes bacterium]|nr:DUF4440 domain-containing protein [Gemmatimonadota bacterium]
MAEITAMLRSSADDWNRGDLEGFLDDYLDSGETTFVGGSAVLHGVPELRRRYQAAYFKDGAPRDALRFEELEIRQLPPHHALALGRYVLFDRATHTTTATGFFSLVLRRTTRGWKIIHDHSSAASS